jgi:hypothetical protein
MLEAGQDVTEPDPVPTKHDTMGTWLLQFGPLLQQVTFTPGMHAVLHE